MWKQKKTVLNFKNSSQACKNGRNLYILFSHIYVEWLPFSYMTISCVPSFLTPSHSYLMTLLLLHWEERNHWKRTPINSSPDNLQMKESLTLGAKVNFSPVPNHGQGSWGTLLSIPPLNIPYLLDQSHQQVNILVYLPYPKYLLVKLGIEN